MADDLGDEWWLKEATASNADVNKGKLDDNVKLKNSKKRKADSNKDLTYKKKKKVQDTKGENEKIPGGGNGSKKDKKRNRKKITDEPDEVLSKPGTPEDVTALLTTTLKQKISLEAFYDLLPDIENDFYPSNCDLLEPDKYLQSILVSWRSTVKKSIYMKKTGSPSLLIVTSSAIRAVELNRQMKGFFGDKCKIAKLFAKHMKIEEQKLFLSKTVCQVGIGTPGRILMLLRQGSLDLESSVAVVMDWNWRDSKFKRLVDIPEVKKDLVDLLKDYVLLTVKASSCRIALL